MTDSETTGAPARRGFIDGLIGGIFVPKSQRTARHWVISVVGGIAVGIGAVMLFRLVFGKDAIVDTIDSIGGFGAFLGFLLVVVMLWVGLVVLVMGTSRRAMRRAMDLDDTEPVPAMMASFRFSALALASQAGLILLVLFDGLAAPLALSIAVLLLLAEQWLSWRIYANSDELWQRATLESCALHSALLSFVLGGWAVLNAYDLAPSFSPLAMLVTLLASGVVTTIFAVRRRGVLD